MTSIFFFCIRIEYKHMHACPSSEEAKRGAGVCNGFCFRTAVFFGPISASPFIFCALGGLLLDSSGSSSYFVRFFAVGCVRVALSLSVPSTHLPLSLRLLPRCQAPLMHSLPASLSMLSVSLTCCSSSRFYVCMFSSFACL